MIHPTSIWYGEALDIVAASDLLEYFIENYGPEPTLLAAHAAVIERLRPEILALLRKNFFGGTARNKVSLDADVLFGPLCFNLGGSYFKMDTEVRRQLLILLNAWSSRHKLTVLRSKQVAHFIRHYVAWRHRKTLVDQVEAAYLNQIHWVALAFDEPQSAVESLFSYMSPILAEQTETPSASPTLALRFSGVAKVLELPMSAFIEELNYARALDIWSSHPDRIGYKKVKVLVEHFQDEVFVCNNIALPPPRTLLQRFDLNSESDNLITKSRLQEFSGDEIHQLPKIDLGLPPVDTVNNFEHDPNLSDSPLHQAVCDQDTKRISQLLLEQPKLIYARGKDYNTPLHVAAKYGLEDVITLLLNAGAEIDPRNHTMATPLILASAFGHSQAVHTLLASNANGNAQNVSGSSSLMFAVYYGHLEIVKMLLAHDADIDLVDNDGTPAIAFAAFAGRLSIFNTLMEKNPVLDKTTKNGKNLLNRAAAGGCLEIVVQLLHLDIDQADSDGWTALLNAAYAGYTDIVQFLLDIGANPHNTISNDWTPLHVCCQQKTIALANHQGNHAATVKALIAFGFNPNYRSPKVLPPLHLAVYYRATLILQTLLTTPGIDPNLVNHDNLTPLLYAANQLAYEIIPELLRVTGIDVGAQSEKGENCLILALNKWNKDAPNTKEEDIVKTLAALLNHQDVDVNQGLTPALWIAINKQLWKVCELLVNDRRTDLEWSNSAGETALHLCATTGGLTALHYLIHAGVDIQHIDHNGQTALVKAIQRGDITIVEELLVAGASTDRYPSENVLSPLEVAIDANSLDCVQLLLSKGAIINHHGLLGTTVLHHAAATASVDICKLLIAKGAESMARDRNGMTPFLCAVASNNLAVVEYLLSQGADVKQKNNHDWTALHLAAQRNFEAVLNALISAGAPLHVQTSSPALTPLQAAAEADASKCVEKLLEVGSLIDESSKDRGPPLFLAIANGHFELAITLLLSGATTDGIDSLTGLSILQAFDKRQSLTQNIHAEFDVIEAQLASYLKHGGDLQSLAKCKNIDKKQQRQQAVFAPLVDINASTLNASLSGPWFSLSSIKSAYIIEQYCHDIFQELPPSEKIQVSWCLLPFYKELVLVRVRHTDWPQPFLARFLLITQQGDQAYLFNGESIPVHNANKADSLEVTELNVVEYLRFFCFFIHSKHGLLYLIDSDKDIWLNTIQDQNLLAKAAGMIKPPTIKEVNEEGHFVVAATLIYGFNLFQTEFKITKNGMVEESKDESLALSLAGRLSQAPSLI